MELLMEYRARARFTEPDDYVFAAGTGRRDGQSNVRRRFLAPAVEKANAKLADEGGEEIATLTPHGLRRTFASLLLANGADVPHTMAPPGHSDPKMTLGIYAKVIASDTDNGAALDELIGHSMDTTNPHQERGSEQAADGIRTHDLLHGKHRESGEQKGRESRYREVASPLRGVAFRLGTRPRTSAQIGVNRGEAA